MRVGVGWGENGEGGGSRGTATIETIKVREFSAIHVPIHIHYTLATTTLFG